LFTVAQILLLFLLIAVAADTILLFSRKRGITGRRELQHRFSNGDENPVSIFLKIITASKRAAY
jgi:uncharacterized protein (DUF58 family)